MPHSGPLLTGCPGEKLFLEWACGSKLALLPALTPCAPAEWGLSGHQPQLLSRPFLECVLIWAQGPSTPQPSCSRVGQERTGGSRARLGAGPGTFCSSESFSLSWPLLPPLGSRCRLSSTFPLASLTLQDGMVCSAGLGPSQGLLSSRQVPSVGQLDVLCVFTCPAVGCCFPCKIRNTAAAPSCLQSGLWWGCSLEVEHWPQSYGFEPQP